MDDVGFREGLPVHLRHEYQWIGTLVVNQVPHIAAYSDAHSSRGAGAPETGGAFFELQITAFAVRSTNAPLRMDPGTAPHYSLLPGARPRRVLPRRCRCLRLVSTLATVYLLALLLSRGRAVQHQVRGQSQQDIQVQSWRAHVVSSCARHWLIIRPD